MKYYDPEDDEEAKTTNFIISTGGDDGAITAIVGDSSVGGGRTETRNFDVQEAAMVIQRAWRRHNVGSSISPLRANFFTDTLQYEFNY